MLPSRKPDVSDIHSNGELHVLTRIVHESQGPLTVFDIGGNIGEYTSLVLEVADKAEKNVTIHVFEPQQVNVTLLRDKFRDRPEVIVNDVGLSDREQTLPIFTEETGSAMGSLYHREFFKQQGYSVSEELIRLTTFERYARQHAIDHIDLVKIDVEGHELSVVKGMKSYLDDPQLTINWIQFEYGGAYEDAGATLEEMYAVLGHRYQLGQVREKEVVFAAFEPAMENFVYSNYLAKSKTGDRR